MQQQAYSGDVGDGIHGAHLVKVDLLHGNAVDVAFRLGDFLINRENIQLDHGRNGQAADNAADIPQMTVVVMVGVVGILFLPMNGYCHMGAQNSAFFALLRRKTHAGNAQCVEFLHKGVSVRQQLQ